jgi:hypothetical protein
MTTFIGGEGVAPFEIVMKQQYMKMVLASSDKVMIDVFNNRFSGPIPKTVGNLTALVMLNMHVA